MKDKIPEYLLQDHFNGLKKNVKQSGLTRFSDEIEETCVGAVYNNGTSGCR